MAEIKDISVNPVSPHSPVVIARCALRKLAEMALAPTPENYTREYRRAAGLTAVASEEPQLETLAADSAAALLGMLETIGQTTTGLAVGIERFDGDLKSMLGEVDQLGPDGVRGLLERLTVSRLALEKTVEASRLELDATRKHLDQVSAELERSRAQARTDPLTGFVNRRAMEEIIGREIARARRTKTPFALAILDIDHFKRINDEHGHDVGDQALIHLATVAKSGLRDTDVVCRYGGEEFVLILPGAEAQGALFVVDRLRVKVENSPLLIDAGKVQIRFSAGIAELGADGENRDTLLKRADEALYAAKRAGRNRVFVATIAAAA